MRQNVIIDTDAYKLTHPSQYPEGLSRLYSYGESRLGSKFPTVSWIGIQSIIEDHFLQRVTNDMIEEAEEEAFLTFGQKGYFQRKTWEKLRDLGYFPMTIKAVPEGTEMPIDNALFSLESDPKYPWFAPILNSFETTTMHVWYPTTIATNSLYLKRDLLPFYEKTGTPELIDIAVNDFGLRGATSSQSGARGGMGHLLHFRGSDNMTASRYIKDVYGFKGRALSVWATEHSVATSYGPGRGEFDYTHAQLDRAPLDAIVSLVIDSYDTMNYLRNVIGSDELKQKIIARLGRTVFRPDSGDPKQVIKECLEILEQVFGSTINAKGYKVINHNVGLLQGDGMKRETIIDLFRYITALGWSADNLVVGSGGGLLQEGFNRDTQRFAIKASRGERTDNSGVIHGFDIRKMPKTDTSKGSKAGFQKVEGMGGSFRTIGSNDPRYNEVNDIMITLYQNGQFNRQKFEDLLVRAKI